MLAGPPSPLHGARRMGLSREAQGPAAAALHRREQPARSLADDADKVARACHAIAVRFHRGGKLVVFGSGGPTTDAQHISVEFVHQLRYLAEPEDVALGLSSDGDDLAVLRGLEVAAEHGLLTVALLGGDGGRIAAAVAAEHLLLARSDDPLVVKEVHVTTYHLLWELVHVFFEQPGVLGPEVV